IVHRSTPSRSPRRDRCAMTLLMFAATWLLSWKARLPGDGATAIVASPARLRRAGALLCGIVVILAGAASSAQTTYGRIEGRITDATGGALPGAVVTVTQPAIGVARSVVSDELGRYRVLS